MKLDEVELRSPSFDRFPFLLYVHFYNLKPLGSGYHEIKVNELPDWEMGQRQRTEDPGKIIFAASVFCLFFFFAVIHTTFKHAPWKESTIKRSVDDLELFDYQRRKSFRIIWFLSSPWSGFRQLSTACKIEQLTRNASVPTFEKLQSPCTTDLYHHESCLIKLALEKLNRRQQLLDRREANPKVIC